MTYVLAARFWNVTPAVFRSYDTEEQAEMIAGMIVENQTEAVLADQRHKEMMRKSGQRGR